MFKLIRLSFLNMYTSALTNDIFSFRQLVGSKILNYNRGCNLSESLIFRKIANKYN